MNYGNLGMNDFSFRRFCKGAPKVQWGLDRAREVSVIDCDSQLNDELMIIFDSV